MKISADNGYNPYVETEAKISKQNETKSAGAEQSATYEKSTASEKKITYTVNKMSDEDRASLVEKLKSEQAARESQLVSIVNDMLNGQAGTYVASTGDDFWKFLASGNYTVDAETKAQAQADIAEDGYYGVAQTSQRMFDFAQALAGDDPEQMKKMQNAIAKGYAMAEKTWGGTLPGICQKTLDATNKLFDDYYASLE